MNLPDDLFQRSLEMLNVIAVNPSAAATQIAKIRSITERSVQIAIRTLRDIYIAKQRNRIKFGNLRVAI